MASTITHKLTVAALVLFGVVLSGIIHELGHAIAGKMAGLKVVYLQVLPPGLRLSGEPTGFWRAAVSISGMLFAVLVGLAGTLAALLLGTWWPCVRYAVWLFVPMMAQALAWSCLPLVGVLGIKSPSDDAQKFTEQTKWPPLVVSLLGFVLVVFCVAILTWAVLMAQ